MDKARSSEALFVISVKSEAPSFIVLKERIQKIRAARLLPNFPVDFNSCFIAVFHFEVEVRLSLISPSILFLKIRILNGAGNFYSGIIKLGFKFV